MFCSYLLCLHHYISTKKVILTWHHLRILHCNPCPLSNPLNCLCRLLKKQFPIMYIEYRFTPKTNVQIQWPRLPGLCFFPLFHGVFPVFAFEILVLRNFSLSSRSSESSSLYWVWAGGELWSITSCELLRPGFLLPLLRTKCLGSSVVATALTRSVPPPRKWKFKFLPTPNSFQAEKIPFSFPKMNGFDNPLSWNGIWAVCILKCFPKAGCVAPISGYTITRKTVLYQLNNLVN